MKTKKITTLLITSALLLSFTACNSDKKSEKIDTSSAVNSSSEISEKSDIKNTSSTITENSSNVAENNSSISTEVSSEETSKEYSQPEISYDPNDVHVSNGIVIAGTRAMENYGGGVKSAANYAGYLNNFKTAVGDNINVYSMPIPIASAFYAPEEYKNSVNAHIKTFASLRDNLSGVKDINLLNALAPHTGESIYSRTDHHWQALGAYYAAEEFAKVADVPFTDITGFTKEVIPDFVGSLYGFSKDEILKQNPEDFIYYVPNQNYTARFYTRDTFKKPFENSLFFSGKSYSMFIGGDSYITEIDTGVNNGRKLLVFKDSYGNALAPFLISSFEQVYMVDIRYFQFNALQFIKEHNITDVCFSLSAFSVVTKNGSRVKDMSR